jgi:hypothetical protein
MIFVEQKIVVEGKQMSNDNHTIISAQPGWYVVSYVEMGEGAGEGSCFEYEPIIAWGIEQKEDELEVTAITREIVGWRKVQGTREPDGRFDFDGARFYSEQEALAYACKTYNQWVLEDLEKVVVRHREATR